MLEIDTPTFQKVPIPDLLKTLGDGDPKSHLIAVTLSNPNLPAHSVLGLQSKVLEATKGLPAISKTYTSVYKYAGDEAQPPGHPPVTYAPDSWLILVLVEGEGRKGIEAKVDEVLGDWKGGEARWGVWGGEIFME